MFFTDPGIACCLLRIDIEQKSVAWSAIFLFIIPVQGAPTISTPNVCFPSPRFYPSLCSPTSTTHDALALLSASRLSIFLFPIPFLLSLSRSSFPLFAFWLFELSPSLLRSFPYRRFSTSSTLLSRRIFPTKNNGTHVVGCLLPCTVASTNIYLFSFFFILDFSSSSIFHQNSFDCPKKNFSSSIFLSIVQFYIRFLVYLLVIN